MLKRILRKIIPKQLISLYHLILAILANVIYGRPSEKMIVIGVTGTSGKTTASYLMSKMLESAGYKVGMASTLLFKVDKKEWLNDKKMTMLGRFELQKLLSQMKKANCQYAIVETTSEGIKQHRHRGINYDIVVFTNLYKEHIESHGSFENYKKAKLKLFEKLKTERPKLVAGQRIEKTIIVNADDENSPEFFNAWAEKKFIFTTKNESANDATVIRGENQDITKDGIGFDVSINDGVKTHCHASLYGDHNVYNALAAIAVGVSQEISLPAIAKGLASVEGTPGRIESISEGQDFNIFVDYAFEPRAVTKLYEAMSLIPHQKIVHVLGSTGGGRDKDRRPKLGEIAGKKADYVIVTNEDPYDEDPQAIIDEVAAGAMAQGKAENQDLFKIMDRREAIHKALSLAKEGDIVLITGKGSEQAIVVENNKKIPWDDRDVVREELAKL